MAGFFFYFVLHLPHLIAPPPSPSSLVLPASFLFFASLFLQLCSISSLSGCTLIALCVWNGRGQVAQGSYYSRAHVADGVSRGAARVNGGGAGSSGAAAEPRGGCQMCQKHAFQLARRGRRGTSRPSGHKRVLLFCRMATFCPHVVHLRTIVGRFMSG